MDSIARQHGVVLSSGDAANKFKELVVVLHEKCGKVVILVDEYDKPLLSRIGQSNVSEYIDAAMENMAVLFSQVPNEITLPYANDPRKLYRIGVEFSAEKRNISR